MTMTTDVDALWRRYKEAPTRADRNALIEAHIPLVRYVASRMLPGLHSSVELQDLVSYGIFGLIDAIEKYDLNAGTKFSTYATTRIRGEITDKMRDLAWEPRSVRQRSRLVASTGVELERSLGRPPTEAELATAVGISVGELRRSASDMKMSRVSSINQTVGHTDEDYTVADTLVAGDVVTEVSPQMGEAASLLAAGIASLPENERTLLQMLYATEVEKPDGSKDIGMALKEIARVLEVTESWVSLLHTRAMVTLQRTLAGQAA